jgi:hypothetical protein
MLTAEVTIKYAKINLNELAAITNFTLALTHAKQSHDGW